MNVVRFSLVPGTRLGAGAALTVATGVGWRLLGANNRELGRSARTHPDADAALADVEQVRRHVVDGVAHVAHDSARRVWTWQLEDAGGELVAVAGRGFRFERDCRLNLAQFRDAARTAPVTSG